MRVLVIDEDETGRATTAMLVDAPTTPARDVAAGLVLARAQTFDAVIVEAYFRRSTRRAVGLIPMLRAASPGSAIVVLTLDWDAAECDRAIELGALAYIEKWPMQLRPLLDACVATARAGHAPVSVRAAIS